MQTSTYEGIKVTATSNKLVQDNLVIEAALQININGEPYTVVMRTPDHDEDLIRGLLYAEDIYKKKEKLEIRLVSEEDNGFSVYDVIVPKEKLGKGYLNKRTLLSVSSCGICGKQKLDDITLKGNSLNIKQTLNASKIKEMFDEMGEKQLLFKNTGGSHAASIFNKNKELITIREDIGRHNAVDKAVGSLIENQNLKEANYLLVSGRVSYEIISKAFIAKIPVIIAVSACSSLAVDYAKEFGICLIGFTRDEKLTIYATPNHIKF
ncbi:formate dehydrogenase accessory sulfurtransferase FdhD [Aureivirga sp. CE67]|uniref:formate dehydrogenase accessory sulfurtransferase FdhD n=1 Tax=Aureivirga sp. CE67 TaxID=1788983 RepID=UPI0018CB217C|nr:formate dehydrogenase accessory sulfurtransferase FdhD [Aureivirga sp. CE67]